MPSLPTDNPLFRASFPSPGRSRLWMTLLAGLLLPVAVPVGSSAQSFAITRTSDDALYLDTPEGFEANYASYRITNTSGQAAADVWVSIGGFTGSTVGPAPFETGVTHLGFLGAGATRTAFFYLASSGATTTPASHTVTVHLDRPPAGAAASASFDLTSRETIRANANKVESTLVGPNPPALGGLMTLTVWGETGTLGGDRVLAFTPATALDWRADAYGMVSSRVELTGGNSGVWVDELAIPPAELSSKSSSDYQVTYTFRALGATNQPERITPSAFISSGQKIKHTTLDQATGSTTIEPAQSEISLRKTADSTRLVEPDTVPYHITLINSGGVDVRLDDLVDDIGLGPALPTYVAGSSTYDGAAVADPELAGGSLAWTAPFDVPAGATRTLSFRLAFPDSAGSYPNEAVGHVGSTQVDSTTSTDDDAPGTWSVFVEGDPTLTLGTSISPMDVVLPGTDLTFRSTVENVGQGTAEDVVVLDSLPAEVDYKLASVADSLPSGVSTSVAFSSDGGASWSYTPVSEGCGAPTGYDGCVTHLRWQLAAGLLPDDGDDAGWVRFVARVR